MKKYSTAMILVIGLIIASFLMQIIQGQCPVP